MRRGLVLLLSLVVAWPVWAAFGIFQTFGPGGTSNLVIPAANNVSANWQKAGLAVIGGIPTRNTQCGATVNPVGGVTPPPFVNDDAQNINAAIAACPVGQVVQLGSGTFQLDYTTENIAITKNITLRGSGSPSGGTAGPLWPSVLQYYNGAWPDNLGGKCGATTGTPPSGTAPGSLAFCANAGALVQMYPAALAGQNAAWGGCTEGFDDPTVSNCGTTLTSDASQGDTVINVTSTANFAVGQWVLIDEDPKMVSTANPVGNGQASISASPEFLNSSASPAIMRLANPDFNCNYSLCTARLNQEIHLVTAVGPGNKITIDSPLTMGFRQSGGHDARMYWFNIHAFGTTPSPFLEGAGIENLTISRGASGGVGVSYCAYCYVKNIEVSYWEKGISVYRSARVQVTGNYVHDTADPDNNGQEYPASLDTGTTESLLDNNIFVLGGKGMVGRAATGNVIAYNYADMTHYQTAANFIGDYWVDMGINSSHMGGTHHHLHEGNWSTNLDGDETHGNAIYHTFFRNQGTGVRSNFTDPFVCGSPQTVSDTSGTGYRFDVSIAMTCVSQVPGPRRAAGPMAFNYWYAYAANVLGLAGVTTAGNGWAYFRCQNSGCGGISSSDKTIWMTGWSAGEWLLHGDANLDGTNGTPFIFRNGNYDYVNAAVVDNAAGYSHSFPNSLYLSVAPSYFGAGASCTYTWPWIDPASGTPVKTASGAGSCTTYSGLPAKARWDAGTPFTQP